MIPVLRLPKCRRDAEVEGWTFLGAGCSRQVLEHPNRPGVVLKVAYEEEANQRERDLWEALSETHLSFSLTPIFGRTEDYAAILMKKAITQDGLVMGSELRNRVECAMHRPFIREWAKHVPTHILADFHSGNWGFISDDYGYMTPGPLIDYAGC